MRRVTAYITVPAMLGLAVLATPLFHTLFGAKWDPSILLFRILLIRGIFVVLNSLYGNYMLALGRSKAIVAMETVRDVTAVIALAVTFPYMAIVTPTDPVWGVTVMLWGQLAATVISWIVALVTVSRITGVSIFAFVTDNLPYLALTLVAAAPVIPLLGSSLAPWLQLFAGFAAGLAVYLIANFLLRSRVQSDAIAYFRGRLCFPFPKI